MLAHGAQAAVVLENFAHTLARVVEFRAEPLPKSNIGKILRRELRDEGRDR